MYTNQNPGQDYLLSSIPAKWIDDLILYSPKFGVQDSVERVFARGLSLALSVTVFPVALAVDSAHYCIKALAQRAWCVVSPSDTSYATAHTTHEVALKCLRGMATFPAGVLYRDVVSNHFLPEMQPDGRIHPTGGLYASAAQQQFPTSTDEVQAIVQEAIRGGKKVSVAGAGFSQGKQTLPPTEQDVHINMMRMDGVAIDPESKTAIVGAGATWSQIQNKADKHGLAVKVMQASNVFSVGGSLSANCHGWDHHEGALGNTVNWIKVVDAKGDLQMLTPDDELFHYVVGGYGMFGVIVEAEFNLADNETLFDYGEKVEVSDYVQYFRERVQTNPTTRMHLYRLSLEHGKLLQTGWAQNYSAVSPRGTATEGLVEEPARGRVMDRIMMQVARNSPMARTMWWREEEKELQKIRKAKRNEIMRPKINGVFANNSSAHREWLQEYFVPGDKLASFLSFLGGVLDDNDVALMNASVRFVTKDERAALGYATEGDRFAIVLFFSQSLNADEIEKTKRWVQSVCDELADVDGTFYLPYMHFATKGQFEDCYPQWQDVKAKKEKHDPNQLFDNGLFQDYLA